MLMFYITNLHFWMLMQIYAQKQSILQQNKRQKLPKSQQSVNLFSGIIHRDMIILKISKLKLKQFLVVLNLPRMVKHSKFRHILP